MNNPTIHMKQLCEELGEKYTIKVIDGEQVIHRDFENGYDVEISGANTSSERKTVTIYLWKNKVSIVEVISNVPQCNIGDRVEELYYKTKSLNSLNEL